MSAFERHDVPPSERSPYAAGSSGSGRPSGNGEPVPPALPLPGGEAQAPMRAGIAEPKFAPRPGLIQQQAGEPTADVPSLRLMPVEVAFLDRALAGLTSREREVLLTICSGGTNEAMAERLCIALPTLRTHLMRLNQKLGTSGKSDVVRFVAATLLEGYRSGQLGVISDKS
ncbi:MAG: helix-turn-helix transcriptional regulator [Planctomycetota bacterium]|nr:helix-turn-helix transcriptional regulator [Planctomycetota bacterium]